MVNPSSVKGPGAPKKERRKKSFVERATKTRKKKAISQNQPLKTEKTIGTKRKSEANNQNPILKKEKLNQKMKGEEKIRINLRNNQS